MKTFILALFCFPSYLFAQEIPKRANTIIAKGASYKQVVNAILDKGFFLKNADSLNGSITTEPKPYGYGQGRMIVNARIKDSTVYISGLANLNATLMTVDFKEYYNIEYFPNAGKNSPAKICFQTLQDIAKSLGGEISYQKL